MKQISRFAKFGRKLTNLILVACAFLQLIGCSTYIPFTPNVERSFYRQSSINDPILVSISDIRKQTENPASTISALGSGISANFGGAVKVVDATQVPSDGQVSLRINVSYLGAKFINIFLDREVIGSQKVQLMLNQAKMAAPIYWKDVVPEFNPANFDDSPPAMQGSYWMGSALLELTLYDRRFGRSDEVQLPIGAQISHTNWMGNSSGMKVVEDAWTRAQSDFLITIAKIISKLEEDQTHYAKLASNSSKSNFGTTAPEGVQNAEEGSSGAIVKETQDSVIPNNTVQSWYETGAAISAGTGWAVNKGLIVTNFHLIQGKTDILIRCHDGRETPATIYSASQINDLALLRLSDSSISLKAIPLSTGAPGIGATVFTIGYPHPDVMNVESKLINGIIRSETGLVGDPRTYESNFPVQEGNSGGPLLNLSGEAIGIVTSTSSAMTAFRWKGEARHNVSYALKSAYLRPLLENAPSTPAFPLAMIDNSNLETLANSVRESIVLVIAK